MPLIGTYKECSLFLLVILKIPNKEYQGKVMSMAPRVLIIFYFLTWVKILWVCSLFDSSKHIFIIFTLFNIYVILLIKRFFKKSKNHMHYVHRPYPVYIICVHNEYSMHPRITTLE